MKLNINQWIGITLVLMMIVFPLFYNLSSTHLHMWDESRYAVNAIEMQHSSNPLIVTFNNKSDWWNSKPPLSVWIQSFSLKLFGLTEFGVRFPSGMAALLCFGLLIVFSIKILKNYSLGIISALTLVSTTGIIRYHVSRTGDVDALFVLLVVFYSLSFFTLLLKTSEKKTTCFLLFSIGLILAYLTKGIAAFIPLPGLLLYAIVQKKITFLFSAWQFYISIFLVLIFVVGYYSLRNYYDPGYINAVLENELGMFAKKSAWKNREFLFYFKGLINIYFYPFAYFLPLSIVSIYYTKNKIIKDIMLFSLIFSISFISIHSLSHTGNEWYDAPAYPFLSLLFASLIYVLYENIKKYIEFAFLPKNMIFIIIVCLIFVFPYIKILESTISKEKYIYEPELEGMFMKKLSIENPSLKEYTVCCSNLFSDQVRFYTFAYNKKGACIRLEEAFNFKVGEIVLACQTKNINAISHNYQYQIIETWNQCQLFLITGRK